MTRIPGSQMTFVHARNLGGFVLIYKSLLALVRETVEQQLRTHTHESTDGHGLASSRKRTIDAKKISQKQEIKPPSPTQLRTRTLTRAGMRKSPQACSSIHAVSSRCRPALDFAGPCRARSRRNTAPDGARQARVAMARPRGWLDWQHDGMGEALIGERADRHVPLLPHPRGPVQALC